MQEEMEQPHHWLLPFTRPLDSSVWDAILRMVERRKAAAVAVSFTVQPELLRLPEQRERQARFEQGRTRLFWLRKQARQAGNLFLPAVLANHARGTRSTS